MIKNEMSENDLAGERHEKPIVVRNTTDLQRLKLEKLMKNPDKPIIIPERPKERGVPVVPDFVRNVMGSSAGAGSGEFHVYRHLRRKEYARQKYMKEKGERERIEQEYHNKIEENKKKADARTAKKRAKRLKRKQKIKGMMKKAKLSELKSELSDSEQSAATNETDSGSETDASNENSENGKGVTFGVLQMTTTDAVNETEKSSPSKPIVEKEDKQEEEKENAPKDIASC